MKRLVFNAINGATEICLHLMYLFHKNEWESILMCYCLVYIVLKTSFFIEDTSPDLLLPLSYHVNYSIISPFDNFDLWWLLNEAVLESQTFANLFFIQFLLFLLNSAIFIWCCKKTAPFRICICIPVVYRYMPNST